MLNLPLKDAKKMQMSYRTAANDLLEGTDGKMH